MNGVDGGWAPHPDAVRGAPRRPAAERGAASRRVVGLGAICDLRTRRVDGARSLSFSVSEFALLDDGRRVILHEDRGFTIGSGAGGTIDHESPESITRDVLNVVLPDDDDSDDDHPWSWLAELCRANGLDVTADDLRRLPYEVLLTDRVTRWLASSERGQER